MLANCSFCQQARSRSIIYWTGFFQDSYDDDQEQEEEAVAEEAHRKTREGNGNFSYLTFLVECSKLSTTKPSSSLAENKVARLYGLKSDLQKEFIKFE